MLLKIAVFLFVFAVLFLIKELFLLLRAIFVRADNYKITTLRLIMVGVALSYVLTIMFTGFAL